MNTGIQSDTDFFQTTTTEVGKNEKKLESNITTFTSGGSKSSTGASPFNSPNYSTASSAEDWKKFSQMFNSKNFPKAKQTGALSTFNFKNCTVGNAVIGGKGAVNLKSTHETFKEGAKKTDIKITGGQFAQPNIGGKADYINMDSDITAGTGGSGLTSSTTGEFVEIDKYPHPFSPEQYLSKLLQTGIDENSLKELLEKKYSVVYLANALPSTNQKRKEMVKTLLKIADMD